MQWLQGLAESWNGPKAETTPLPNWYYYSLYKLSPLKVGHKTSALNVRPQRQGLRRFSPRSLWCASPQTSVQIKKSC